MDNSAGRCIATFTYTDGYEVATVEIHEARSPKFRSLIVSTGLQGEDGRVYRDRFEEKSNVPCESVRATLRDLFGLNEPNESTVCPIISW